MVLKDYLITRVILITVFFLLTSCSMMSKQDAKSSFIVPAQIPEQELEKENELPKNEVENGQEKGTNIELDVKSKPAESAPEKVVPLETEREFKSTTSGTDLLSTLLGKATKAMKLQQWLRAQRALEQALRINPESSKTYVLYGDVYKGMGLEDKSIEMYKRAIFLSGNDDQLRNKLFPEAASD